ncbi:hypothetical protein GCM10022234_34420 [Aeromicrobium panaciterrae]
MDATLPHMWQEINECWHYCHWWRDIRKSRITAMLILIALLVTAAGAVLVAQVRKDGYGSRPAPRSHYDDVDPRPVAL